MSKSKKPTTKAVKAVVKSVVKNGVTQPREGGLTRKVWDIADSLKSSLGRVPTRAEVIAKAPSSANESTVSTQFGYWRKFNGIKGRISAPKPAAKAKAKPAKKGAKAPAKPAAPKAPTPPPAAPVPPAAS